MDIVNKVFYIEVEPKYMTSNIHQVILSKIKEKYINIHVKSEHFEHFLNHLNDIPHFWGFVIFMSSNKNKI